jgi:steroid delta-isomerase-like uncharacterized protein
MASAITADRLSEFLEAWNAHDANRIVSLMTDDCSFHASAGPEFLGRSAVGREAVREAVEEFFRRFPDVRFVDVDSFIAGDRGAAEWTMVWTGADENERRLRGCDLFEFNDGLIRTKNAFRKAVA